MLSFVEHEVDDDIVRGLTLPRLRQLYLACGAVRRLDVGGFPQLARVMLGSTPLANDVDTLRARWPGVTWET